MRTELARVESLRDIARDIFELEVSAPGITADGVAPGQFAQIATGDESRLLSRPISVRSAHGDRMVFAVRAAGTGTRGLRALAPGDALRVTGPLGRGFEWDDTRRCILVGGGIGLAPVLFLRERMRAQNLLIAGFRSAEYAFDCGGADTFVATEDGSLGERGFVTGPLMREIERFRPDAIFACGPVPMLRAVQRVALDTGVEAQISLEERMGCGIGACLTCPCKIKTANGEGWTYKRVCADGPVFDAREVIFDA